MNKTNAAQLNYGHIGALVEFTTEDRSGVLMRIQGELRQISHQYGEVSLNPCSSHESGRGISEFTIAPATDVMFPESDDLRKPAERFQEEF